MSGLAATRLTGGDDAFLDGDTFNLAFDSSVMLTEACQIMTEPDIVVVQSGRKSFSGTFIPDASTLERYCCHDPSTRIYRTDLGDEASGLIGRGAADGDHIVIRTNGTNLTVDALSGGQPHPINSCEPVCTP